MAAVFRPFFRPRFGLEVAGLQACDAENAGIARTYIFGSLWMPMMLKLASTRVPPEFHQVLQWQRGGAGWFEVRFQGFRFEARFHEGSTRGSTRFHQVAPLRLGSMGP